METKVFALYQTDKWHTFESRVLFCVCDSIEKCIELLWGKYGEEQTENEVLLTNAMRDELRSRLQTQCSPTKYEFDIFSYSLNHMYE